MTATEQSEKGLGAILDKTPMLRTILSSVGTVGSLIAPSYLIDYAQRTMLGIDVSPERTTTEYATLGGL